MEQVFLAPWLPPPEPDLARLAMVWADACGIDHLETWPELRKGGIGFGGLPPFLPWEGRQGAQRHLVLLQVRELGALVPGARTAPLPEGWLEALDLASLAEPLSRHPDLGGQACVHVVQVPGPGRARVRSLGTPSGAVLRGVLSRLTAVAARDWALCLLGAGREEASGPA